MAGAAAFMFAVLTIVFGWFARDFAVWGHDAVVVSAPGTATLEAALDVAWTWIARLHAGFAGALSLGCAWACGHVWMYGIPSL